MRILLACLPLLATGAFAHEGYPIPAARAVLRAEPGRAVLDLRVDSIYFIEEVVGLHPMPPRDWPADALAKVEAYANSHLKLEAGGAVRTARLAAARYRQLPWEVTEEGTFFLRLEYPVPEDASGELVLTSTLYEEYRKEMAAEYPGGAPHKADYRLLLEVPGRERTSLALEPGVPARLPLAGARRGALAMAAESVRLGLAASFGVAAAFPALLGLGLWAAAGARESGEYAAAAASAAAGAAFAAARGAPGWEAWAALLASALAAAFSSGRLGLAAALISAGGLGAAWGADAGPLLPRAAAAPAAAALGALAGGALLLEAARRLGLYERAQARLISESRAADLFAARVRLAASALALIGGYGLWLNLHG